MISNQLKSERKAQKTTQKELAEKAGVSIPTIIQIEKGKGTIQTLEKILEALDCEIFSIYLQNKGEIGERIAELRRKKKISQQKVAEIIGVTQTTVSHIENENKGRIRNLEAIARVSGCTLKIESKTRKKAFFKETALTSLNEVWTTPTHIINILIDIFGIFDLDPCSESSDIKKRNSKAKIGYTKQDNGLKKPWFGTVFVNPPYSRTVGKWVKKCYEEGTKNNTKIVIALLASRTDTKWFHSYISGKADVFFIKGRLKFGNSTQSAPFPSMLVVWTEEKYDLKRLKTFLGS